MNHVQQLQSALAEQNVPAFLVSNLASVRWLTNFTGSMAFALVTPDSGGVFVSDSRYTVQASEEVRDLSVRTFGQPTRPVEFLKAQIEELGIERLHFDEESVSVKTLREWTEGFTGVELIPGTDPIRSLRMIKSESEIERLRAACELADACVQDLVLRVAVGRSERELLWGIEDFLRQRGAEPAFRPIVVSGPRTARPHGVASERKLVAGDLLTVDLGAALDGYSSDITRSFVVGKADERQREVYEKLLEAQIAGVEALRPGANGREVDALVRRILDELDLSQYFGHGLGHGLGQLVHDSGRLSLSSDQPIAVSQVWTVEPGVYIEGFGGMRIEDDVLVTDGEPEVLTRFPKILMELG